MAVAIDCSELVQKKIKELPPLPLVVQKLIAVMEDQNSSAEDVNEILSSDQALAGKVLKLVNSSFYGLSGEVATISRAVVILGFSAVRNLGTGLGVVKLMGKTSTDGIQRNFWNHSISTAAAAYVLAKHTGYRDPEEAFIAGLLHDLGQLVLILAVPEEFKEVLALGPRDMLENEQKIIGLTHNKVGQQLLKHWKLPKPLCDAVRFHHNAKIYTGKEDPLVSLVALADTVSCAHGMLYEQPVDEADFRQLLAVTGLDVSETGEILQEMDARVNATRTMLNLGDDLAASPADDAAASKKSVVLICTEAQKAAWAGQILRHYGHELIPMKEFFASSTDGCRADLVLLDPASVTAEQLAKMKPALDQAGDKVAVLGSDRDELVQRVLGRPVRGIPLAFSRCDLEIPA